MKNVVLAVALLASGCSSKGMISAENTWPAVEIVLDRHDAYVNADPNLDAPKRASELRTSAMIRQAYVEAQKP